MNTNNHSLVECESAILNIAEESCDMSTNYTVTGIGYIDHTYTLYTVQCILYSVYCTL